MACNNAYTVYWSGISFAGATQIYTDGNLTTVAPDGLYSVGGIVREMVGGVLGPAQPCPSCVIPCGDPFIGTGSAGEYTVWFSLGNIPGAAVITFSPGVNNDTFHPIPDMCSWEYNGQTISEYSSLLGGYQTGVIGPPDGPPSTFVVCGTNTVELGTNGVSPIGLSYIWDVTSGAFVGGAAINLGSSLPPLGYAGITNNTGLYQSTLLDWNCADLAAGVALCTGGGLNIPPSPYYPGGTIPIAPNLTGAVGSQWPLSGGEYRGATMVIPSPPGTPNNVLKIVVEGPCTSTWWGLDLQCPVELTSIMGSAVEPLGTIIENICLLPATIPYYHVPVEASGNSNPNSMYFDGSEFPAGGLNGQPSGVLGLHDWIFTDPYGEFPLANGVYKMTFDAQDGGGIRDWAVEVGVLEYRDSAIYAPQVNSHALPPESYIADPGATAGVQTTGPRIPGIVKSITPCSEPAACNLQIFPIEKGMGVYNVDFNATAATGAMIIRFAVTPMFTSVSVPCKCTWTYDGVSASEYSSTVHGYTEGLIGRYTDPANWGNRTCGTFNLSNQFGSSGLFNTGTTYQYNPATSTFDDTFVPSQLGPYADMASGGTTLTAAGPGSAFMVIPKPNVADLVCNLVIEAPCVAGGDDAFFEAWVSCPVGLNEFDAGVNHGICGVYTTKLYTACVHTANGISANVQIHDWIFLDVNGVTQCPAGTYPVLSAGNKQVIVSADGIVTNITAC